MMPTFHLYTRPIVIVRFVLMLSVPAYTQAEPSLPPSPAMLAKIQQDAGSEYAVDKSSAQNPSQSWRLHFSDQGINVTSLDKPDAQPLLLRLARFGAGKTLKTSTVAPPVPKGNRVTYNRGAIEEWYVNGPLGLEQGFTVPRSLGENITLELESSWQSSQKEDVIELSNGNNRIYYGALHAEDANGKTLPSKIHLVDGHINLVVDSRQANFPVVIDPILTRKATLFAKDESAYLGFGRSIAISGDGNTALVGTDGNAAYFYTRSPNGWVFRQKLNKPAGLRCNNNGSWFGWSVALSKDGARAVVGASGIFTFWSGFVPIYLFYSCSDLPVYVKQGNQWVLEKLLTTPSITVNDMFGGSVSLSSDGRRLIAGAQKTRCTAINDTCGAVYLYELNTNNQWLAPRRIVNSVSYDVQGGFFGDATAMSGDGLWAMVGASGGNAAWILQRQTSPNSWRIVKKLQFSPLRQAYEFGEAVAISSTGLRAVVTAPSAGGDADCHGNFSHCGSAYSFVRQGNIWSFESAFTAPDSHSNNYFGESVALSANGNRVIVGTSNADCQNGNCGAAYAFDRLGGKWVFGGRVTGPTAGLGGTDLGGNFGGKVSLSQNGFNMLVAARRDNCAAGKECGKVYHYALSP